MISRYKVFGQPQITRVQSNTFVSGNAHQSTFTIVIAGPKSCVVSFKVTIYTSFGPSAEMSINSTDYILNDTFNFTTDSGTGLITLTQFLSIANTPGNRINVQITLESVSKGTISTTSKFWTNFVTV